MKRVLAFLAIILCVVIGPAAARDILVVPVPSGGAQYGSTATTTAAVLSNLLAEIAADMALKAARDHGPVAVDAFRKHGPALLKTMRNWTEVALNTGGRYAIRGWSSGTKFVPELVVGSKNLGFNALAAGKKVAQEGLYRFLKEPEAGGVRAVARRQASPNVNARSKVRR